MKSIGGLVLVLIGLAWQAGCASHPKPVAATRPAATRPVATGRPLLDIGRGGAGLPLDGNTALGSTADLQKGIQSAFERRLHLPADSTPVLISGSSRDNLDRMQIDISHATIQSEFRPGQNTKPVKPEPALSVRQFQYTAWPVFYQSIASYWRMNATDAQFGLIRGEQGAQTLVLTNAREGSFEFQLPLRDLTKIPNNPATRPATRPGDVGLEDLKLDITSDDPHSLQFRMQMKITFLFLPMTFAISGRADVDEWFNVRLSELACSGLDAGGKLVAGFAEPALQKANGKLSPLVTWADARMHLTDVQFHVDEYLHISAKFAGVEQ